MYARTAEVQMQSGWVWLGMRARTVEEPMQGVRQVGVVPARTGEVVVQGMWRDGGDMHARTAQVLLQGVWRGGDMPARTAKALMQGVRHFAETSGSRS